MFEKNNNGNIPFYSFQSNLPAIDFKATAQPEFTVKQPKAAKP